ncbi:H-hydrate dehydratase [Cyathus striatus]|nr:H-hydrate dehydratase [Cyathus striatus]
MPISRSLLDQIKKLIPPLDGSLHKGQSGRVGVLGGALDYTGAPFFASFSALRFGVDLSHVICSPTASSAIKSYSPDLIVHPMLREDLPIEKVKPELESLLSRLHVLIVGPGLGREPYMQSFAKTAISIARDNGMYLVLDADALLLVGQDHSIIKGYRRAVVTPNIVEFKRLSESIGIDPSTPADKRAQLVSRALGGVTVLQKGATDIISTDTTGENADLEKSQLHGADSNREGIVETIEVDVKGGMKRCGGQGDILSGAVGTFMAWGKCLEDGAFGNDDIPRSKIPILAAAAGSMVTRTASRRAFFKEGRGVVTQDMLAEIGKAFQEIFGEEAQRKDETKL